MNVKCVHLYVEKSIIVYLRLCKDAYVYIYQSPYVIDDWLMLNVIIHKTVTIPILQYQPRGTHVYCPAHRHDWGREFIEGCKQAITKKGVPDSLNNRVAKPQQQHTG